MTLKYNSLQTGGYITWSAFVNANVMILNLRYSTQNDRNLSGDDAGDSSEPLMNMLKKMYAEGDDEMKRMLNKAWTESQEKKMKGGDMMDLWNTVEGVLLVSGAKKTCDE